VRLPAAAAPAIVVILVWPSLEGRRARFHLELACRLNPLLAAFLPRSVLRGGAVRSPTIATADLSRAATGEGVHGLARRAREADGHGVSRRMNWGFTSGFYRRASGKQDNYWRDGHAF